MDVANNSFQHLGNHDCRISTKEPVTDPQSSRLFIAFLQVEECYSGTRVPCYRDIHSGGHYRGTRTYDEHEIDWTRRSEVVYPLSCLQVTGLAKEDDVRAEEMVAFRAMRQQVGREVRQRHRSVGNIAVGWQSQGIVDWVGCIRDIVTMVLCAVALAALDGE